MTNREPPTHQHGVSLREAIRVWSYIGINSFGGPAGQIAVMHREVVEGRNWLSERRFLHALNYCMVLPGPEAQQLATYIGWLMHGTTGGLIAGSVFVIPGFIVMLGLAAAYAVFGSVAWVAGLLFGLQAAVIAIVVEAVGRIGKRTLKTPALLLIAAFSFLTIFLLHVSFPFIIIGAGLFGWAVGRQRPGWFAATHVVSGTTAAARPALLPDDDRVDPGAARSARRVGLMCAGLWLVPVALLVLTLGRDNVFAQQAVLFSQSAVVTFGGAYAVLGFIAQQAVDRYGWITAQDMVVGLGLAETTPGPLILVVQFVGFLAAYNQPGSLPPLLAGTLGAILAVWVTFLPCFVFIFLGASYVERLRDNEGIRHALTAIGAAVAGVVLNLAVWFALHTLFAAVDDRDFGLIQVSVPDLSTMKPAAVGIAVLAALLVFGLKIATLRVLAICAALGMVLALTGR